jgi:hypothetical protein
MPAWQRVYGDAVADLFVRRASALELDSRPSPSPPERLPFP